MTGAAKFTDDKIVCFGMGGAVKYMLKWIPVFCRGSTYPVLGVNPFFYFPPVPHGNGHKEER